MKINIKDMTLNQGMNALQKIQTWLDCAAQDRIDFLAEWGTTDDKQNGQIMAHLWREECLRHLAASLREALTARFDPPNASVDRAASAAQIQQLVGHDLNEGAKP